MTPLATAQTFKPYSSPGTPFSAPAETRTTLATLPQDGVHLAGVQGSVLASQPIEWGKALAIPAYAYAGASGALSGLTAFATRFPPGGVIINPTGAVPNPEWTRYFVDGTLAHRAQPVLAGVSAAVCAVRGVCELREAARSKNDTMRSLGLLDLSIAGMSAVQFVAPITGTVGTLALTLLRAVAA